MAHTYTDATFAVDDGIAEFTMNRPDVLNALTDGLRVDYKAMLDEVQGNGDIRALILRGEGRAFSAGGNVKNMGERMNAKAQLTETRDGLIAMHDWLERLYNLDCPVIAAVDGLAFGGGFSLALVSDFIMATPRSKFSAVFGRIGLVPDMGVVYTLPRVVGLPKAKDIMYTARTVEADEALALGIVHSLHEPDALLPAARDFASKLARGSKNAIAATKRMTNRSSEATYRQVAEWEADAQSMMFSTDFNNEAVRRFLAKEDPLYNWDAMDKDAG
ncbi:MAG: enoyl-CoA hydratase/isomerase family protein [Alphaproteobacteria bacterium]